MLALLCSIVTCAVGSNFGAPDGAALHVLECDTDTGAAKIVQSVKGVEGTTYFQVSKDRRWLYSVIVDRRGGKDLSAVVKFALDGKRIGAMTRLADLPCEAPCHVALSPDEKLIGFAAYGSAICGTVGVDGRGLVTSKFPDDAMGPNRKRQQKAFAHQVFFPDPAGVGPANTMGVVDLGCDRIRFFEPATMKELPAFAIKADPGDGPRHSLFAFGNKLLYTVNELDSSVTARAFDGAAFRTLGKVSTLPAGFDKWEKDGETLATKAAAIKLTADGKVLMASNRGYDSIVFYEVGTTGALTLRNIAKLTGRFPRDFELMPGEKFMVVGHKMSDEIQVYRFDRGDCSLKPVGAPIACWKPLCFKFL